MKGVIPIYTLTEQQAQELELTPQSIVEIMQNIGWYSGEQDMLTQNLTILRNACIRGGCKELFDRALKVAGEEIHPEDMNGCEWRFSYTAEDFGNSEEPYREVFMQPTAFLRQRALDRLAVAANKCGYKGFKATYKAYEKSMRQVNASTASLTNPSDFPNQPMELECGEWQCDHNGVSKVMLDRVEYACLHPIMPVERLVNIDTGEEKLRIAFYKGRYWRDFIASKRDLFDSAKIIQFSALGVSVTSKSARLLSEFICDVETLNPELIPESQSVSRLGYIGDGGMFSPYVDDLTFDGDANYGSIYAAISESGSYDEWLKEVIKCRNDSTTARIMLAASFASPLVGKLGCLPFFVHLWSVASETGKTVSLMLAASVWGDPALGRYIQSFNSTQVGHEKTAAFLNNIPMCIDELQLSKDSHGRSKFDVYQLAQGVGRTRGNKSGGIDKTPTWALCILTTGESPIVQDNAGAGAVNRVIEIECLSSDKVIRDGLGTSSCIKQNYGFAGRRFIEAMTDAEFEAARVRYQQLYKELASGETTEKQAMAAAMVILGDELADKHIFHTGRALTVADMGNFLKTKASVSAGERGYAYMCGWVSANSNRFLRRDGSGEYNEPAGDIFGIIEDDTAYINKGVFASAAAEQGFDERALLSWLRTSGLIQTRGRNYTRGKRINGVNTECVALKLTKNDDEISLDDYEEILP